MGWGGYHRGYCQRAGLHVRIVRKNRSAAERYILVDAVGIVARRWGIINRGYVEGNSTGSYRVERSITHLKYKGRVRATIFVQGRLEL